MIRFDSLWEHSDAFDQVLVGVFVLRHHLPIAHPKRNEQTKAQLSLREVYENMVLLFVTPHHLPRHVWERKTKLGNLSKKFTRSLREHYDLVNYPLELQRGKHIGKQKKTNYAQHQHTYIHIQQPELCLKSIVRGCTSCASCRTRGGVSEVRTAM